MPRPKRPRTEDDAEVSAEAAVPNDQTEGASAEGSTRPKRIRKQTERYATTVATVPVKKPRAKKTATTAKTTTTKRATKGKAKAVATQEELEPGVGTSARIEESPAPIAPVPVPAKKARVTKEKPVPKEKRQAQFRSHCPQNVLERAERVRIQRFFMIDRSRNGEELKEEFKVLGSTGNVYTVVIDHKPRCDCPDNRRGNHCKHIMFIFLKVLSVPITSHIWYQKALLTTELETVFAQAPEAPNAVTNPRIREAFLRATGQTAESSSAPANNKRRIPGEEDDCPICYDGMHGVAESSLVFCEECGNALHKECWKQYETSTRKNFKELTCVWCRSEWGVAPAAKAGGTGVKNRYGFLNLADAVGVDSHRDTSTYYHGRRTGYDYY